MLAEIGNDVISRHIHPAIPRTMPFEWIPEFFHLRILACRRNLQCQEPTGANL